MNDESGNAPLYANIRTRNHKLIRIIALILIVLLAILAYSNREFLQDELVVEFGILPLWVSALIMVFVVALGVVLLVPNSILFVMAGALFGTRLGLVLSLGGFTLGATLAFLIARTLARDMIDRRAHSSIVQMSRYVSAQGWKAVAVLRAVPVMPTFLINYLLGTTQIRFRDYVWASAVFMTPSCFIITYAGATGRHLLTEESINAQRLLVAAALIIILVVFSVVVRRRLKDRWF